MGASDGDGTITLRFGREVEVGGRAQFVLAMGKATEGAVSAFVASSVKSADTHFIKFVKYHAKLPLRMRETAFFRAQAARLRAVRGHRRTQPRLPEARPALIAPQTEARAQSQALRRSNTVMKPICLVGTMPVQSVSVSLCVSASVPVCVCVWVSVCVCVWVRVCGSVYAGVQGVVHRNVAGIAHDLTTDSLSFSLEVSERRSRTREDFSPMIGRWINFQVSSICVLADFVDERH